MRRFIQDSYPDVYCLWTPDDCPCLHVVRYDVDCILVGLLPAPYGGTLDIPVFILKSVRKLLLITDL
jgi:hypothetical protein